MPSGYDIVFWQNIPSLHQAPLMRSLASDLGKRVLIVVAEDLPADRRAMGWADIDFGEADLIVGPSVDERLELVESNRDATAHVFSGLNVYPAVSHAMAALARGRHNHIAIITEPWDSRGLSGWLRAIKFALRRRSLRHIHTVFACGVLAGKQLISLGFDAGKIAAFGYFVSGPTEKRRVQTSGDPRLVFVGTFTEWKNPGILLQALAMTGSNAWELTMIGDGPLRADTIQKAKDLNLSHRVSFVTSMPNEAVLSLIAASDLLVLPSKYDGWGAVVSEALMAGTPVVVTEACGASDLVRSALQGDVIEPANLTELARVLDFRFGLSPVTEESRLRLTGWSSRAISPRAAAEYLWDTVTRDCNAQTSPAPWVTST